MASSAAAALAAGVLALALATTSCQLVFGLGDYEEAPGGQAGAGGGGGGGGGGTTTGGGTGTAGGGGTGGDGCVANPEIQAGQDTHLDSTLPDENFGQNELLTIDSKNRALLHFDVSPLQGKTVCSAELRLDVVNDNMGSQQFSAYKIIDTVNDWAEGPGCSACDGAACWNYAAYDDMGQHTLWIDGMDSAGLGNGFCTTAACGGDVVPVEAGSTIYRADVTVMVADWLATPAANKGVILVTSGAGAYDIASAESTDRERPVLVVRTQP